MKLFDDDETFFDTDADDQTDDLDAGFVDEEDEDDFDFEDEEIDEISLDDLDDDDFDMEDEDGLPFDDEDAAIGLEDDEL